MATATELIEARELFRNLTLRELRGKYKRSALGWTWSLAQPARDHGDLFVRVPGGVQERHLRGGPVRPQELSAVPAVRFAALEFPGDGSHRRHGCADSKRRADQEGVLPSRGAHGQRRGLVGGAVRDRARRSRRRPAARREQHLSVPAGHPPGDGRSKASSSTAWRLASVRSTCTSETCSTSWASLCSSGSTRPRSCIRLSLVPATGHDHGP